MRRLISGSPSSSNCSRDLHIKLGICWGWFVVSTAVVLLLVILLLLGTADEEEGCDVDDEEGEVLLVRICSRSAGCEEVLGAANMIVST